MVLIPCTLKKCILYLKRFTLFIYFFWNKTCFRWHFSSLFLTISQLTFFLMYSIILFIFRNFIITYMNNFVIWFRNHWCPVVHSCNSLHKSIFDRAFIWHWKKYDSNFLLVCIHKIDVLLFEFCVKIIYHGLFENSTCVYHFLHFFFLFNEQTVSDITQYIWQVLNIFYCFQYSSHVCEFVSIFILVNKTFNPLKCCVRFWLIIL